MAEPKEVKGTLWKYTIEIVYNQDGKEIKMKDDRVQSMVIEYDFEGKNMPIIIMKITFDKKVLDHMINNTNKILYLTLKKFKDDTSINIYTKVFSGEFYYFIDNNMTYVEDLNYGEKIEQDDQVTNTITIGLMKKDLILDNKTVINTVYNGSKLLDIIGEVLDSRKLLIEEMDYTKTIKNLIVTPVSTKTKFLAYVNNQYSLYDTPYRFFYDFDITYLLSSSGKAVPSKYDKYTDVIINIDNNLKLDSKVKGLVEDKKKKCYIIYCDPTNINVSEDTSTDLSYNTVIGVDSDGNTEAVELNSNIEGDRFKVARLTTNNLTQMKNLQHSIESEKYVINVIKEQLDSSVFTINKAYYIKAYDKFKKYNGRYLLARKKELYIKEAKGFQMTTVFTFKKCPST